MAIIGRETTRMTAFYRALLRLYPASFRADYVGGADPHLRGERARSRPRRRRVRRDRRRRPQRDRRCIGRSSCRTCAIPRASLNASRGFALAAVLVTALGVGANTATFSVADFVLVRPLPFKDPHELVRLCEGPRERRRLGMHEPDVAGQLPRRRRPGRGSFEAWGAFNAHRRQPGRRRRAGADPGRTS